MKRKKRTMRPERTEMITVALESDISYRVEMYCSRISRWRNNMWTTKDEVATKTRLSDVKMAIELEIALNNLTCRGGLCSSMVSELDGEDGAVETWSRSSRVSGRKQSIRILTSSTTKPRTIGYQGLRIISPALKRGPKNCVIMAAA